LEKVIKATHTGDEGLLESLRGYFPVAKSVAK